MSAAPPDPSLAVLPSIRLLEGLARLHEAVVVLDRHGRVTWMSDAAESLCGDAARHLGRPYGELVAVPGRAEELRRRMAEEGSLANERVEFVTASGQRLLLEVSMVRVPGETMSDTLYVAIVRPMQAQARDDRELQHTIDYLSAILDCSPEAVVAVDCTGFVTYVNPAIERLLDYAPADVLDKPISLLVRNSADLERIVSALGPGSDLRAQDVEVRRRDGSALTVSVSASPLRLRDGRRAGTVVTLRDVTERRRFEAELARKNAELEHYVHAVSHDLRSPLVALLGFSRLLRQDYGEVLGDTGRHFLDRVEQAGRTMETLIHDLLEVSRIGEAADRKTQVDPLKILLQLRGELKPRLEAQGIELLLPESPPLVLCDRTRLYQIFSNLIGNAVDHMGARPDAWVRVGVEEEEEHHHLVVSDNGAGIDPTHHERIFEIFQSLGPRSDGRRGTGVGLAIVKKIAETHGGRVWVESAPGAGAAFHVVLPRG
jgi:PAS domain S-box-containing protein